MGSSMGRAALTEVVAVLLHLLDVVLGQHGRRVPHERGGEIGGRWPRADGRRERDAMARDADHRAAYSTPSLPARHRDRAFIALRTGLERSNYAGLLPFPFLLPWEMTLC